MPIWYLYIVKKKWVEGAIDIEMETKYSGGDQVILRSLGCQVILQIGQNTLITVFS